MASSQSEIGAISKKKKRPRRKYKEGHFNLCHMPCTLSDNLLSLPDRGRRKHNFRQTKTVISDRQDRDTDSFQSTDSDADVSGVDSDIDMYGIGRVGSASHHDHDGDAFALGLGPSSRSNPLPPSTSASITWDSSSDSMEEDPSNLSSAKIRHQPIHELDEVHVHISDGDCGQTRRNGKLDKMPLLSRSSDDDSNSSTQQNPNSGDNTESEEDALVESSPLDEDDQLNRHDLLVHSSSSDDDTNSSTQQNPNSGDNTESEEDALESSPLDSDQPDHDLDGLLYPDAQVTKKESLLLIMAHCLRHGLTHEGLSSLLQLLQFHLPRDTFFPVSKYLFNKHFEGFCGPLDCHVYCGSCQGYVGTDGRPCSDCGKVIHYDDSITSGNYFIIFSISQQIKILLEDPQIQNKLSKSSDNVHSGLCYQQLPMGEGDLSVTWGSDGAAVFSSSNFSIWPLQLMINELPYAVRRKHILLGGLWFGSGKPRFDSFLKPVIQEMNIMSSKGVSWVDAGLNPRNSKVFPGPLTCDSVARCQLQNIMQFNGKYGCSWCLHPGEQVEKGRGHANVYPLTNLEELPRQRDERAFKQDCHLAVETNTTVNGVKGPSIILLLFHFNIISGFVVDYMHTVCLGVVRALTFLWLENTEKPCYIGNCLSMLNERLSHIRPPAEVMRIARSLSNRRYWKAHEWRAWLLHYSPSVLKHVLPFTYYAHWMTLVTAVYILSKNCVDHTMINQAEVLLVKFVLEFEDLYGKEYMTYNVHQLIHMADSVRNWGPLWSISCYAFESMNHKLGKMISGTQYVQVQISKKFLLSRILPHIALDCFQESESQRNFFESSINHFPLSKSIQRDVSGILLRGAPKLLRLGNNEGNLLQQLGYTCETVLCYSRVSIRGVTITTDTHTHKRRKRIDCYISLKNGTVAVVKRIILVCLSCNEINSCSCEKTCMLYVSVLKIRSIFVVDRQRSITHGGLHSVKGHKEYRLCSLTEFESKVAFIDTGKDEVLSILPNIVDQD
ncbi:uncharacterized protein LOC110990825 [Acanthaster planci]|uniref:Uncharacterized protein LOC110990825 n=1 Tax=Acanthaster planci TaxID=133434 RepID=A0A8B8A2L5_ACAPL|nr:uncharacterized protein LOC110990825 [Acanthaster planci]